MPRYIEAEFALRFYQDICKGIACYECQMRDDDGACKIEDYLRSLPTADVVPVKHGRWIFEPKDALEAMFTLPKCSICGHESSDAIGRYCPRCGAKMEVEDDG